MNHRILILERFVAQPKGKKGGDEGGIE